MGRITVTHMESINFLMALRSIKQLVQMGYLAVFLKN